MNDQFPSFSWHLPPETPHYWVPNAMFDLPRPPSNPWGQSTPSVAEIPNGGILENLGQPPTITEVPSGGILGDLGQPVHSRRMVHRSRPTVRDSGVRRCRRTRLRRRKPAHTCTTPWLRLTPIVDK